MVCNVVPNSPVSTFGNTFLPAVGSSSENQFPAGSCLEDFKILKTANSGAKVSRES